MKGCKKKLGRLVLMLLLANIFSSAVFSQSLTIVEGVIKDSASDMPLQSVSVFFKGGSATVSDAAGHFRIATRAYKSKLFFTIVGYKTVSRSVERGVTQNIDVNMIVDYSTSNIVIKTHKRAKYRNKNNPAVELIKKVIANKSKNRPEHYNYVEYNQYEKMSVSLSNLSSGFLNSGFLKNYRFLFENKDTVTLPGETLYPVYMEEILSKNYLKKEPSKNKKLIEAHKRVDYGQYVDNAGISTFLKRLYENVDIYDDNINLFTNQFLSPIAELSPSFYMFYIRDTVKDEKGHRLVDMYFTPRNTNSFLFRGVMQIAIDEGYAVKMVDMRLSASINLNFIRNFHVKLSFIRNDQDERYHLSESNIMAEAALTKGSKTGIFGKRFIHYYDFKVNQPRDKSYYEGDPVDEASGSFQQDNQFWTKNRPEVLSPFESKTYQNIDSLQNMKSYQMAMKVVSFFVSGYIPSHKVEIGPTNSFYSYNPVEGLKLRFGGRTLPSFSKRIYFETYAAYGFKDEQFKYFLSTTYSLNNKSIYQFPLNYIRASIQHDTKIPGQDLQFVQEDNILLSFKRGKNDKYLYNDFFRFDYVHELKDHFSFSAGLKYWNQDPAGGISYSYYAPSTNQLTFIHNLTTTEITGEIRWAPHEEFYQTKIYRIPIINKYPIFTLDMAAGVKGLLNGDYNYQRLNLRIEKRVYASQFGYADIVTEGGYIFGKLPYPLQTIHRANQTYAYQLYSYNLMNFLEFVSDHYASFNMDYFFNGFFFNRVPLFRRLKLREVISFKALYGGVRDENNPNLHKDQIQYLKDANGVSETYNLGGKPYLEGSVGVANILKFFRVDLVRRFNYLDHPDVAKWGIRARFKFDF